MVLWCVWKRRWSLVGDWDIKIVKHKNTNEKFDIVVKDYENIKPKIDVVDYVLDDVIKVCVNKLFHTIEYKCVYDIKFTNIANNEKVILTVTNGEIWILWIKWKNQNCTEKWIYIR